LTFDLISIGEWGIMMDCTCAMFGDFSFSRFSFIVQTDRQTDRQNHTHRDAYDCYTHATPVGMSNNWQLMTRGQRQLAKWTLDMLEASTCVRCQLSGQNKSLAPAASTTSSMVTLLLTMPAMWQECQRMAVWNLEWSHRVISLILEHLELFNTQ